MNIIAIGTTKRIISQREIKLEDMNKMVIDLHKLVKYKALSKEVNNLR